MKMSIISYIYWTDCLFYDFLVHISLLYFSTALGSFSLLICKFLDSKAGWVELTGRSVSASLYYQRNQTQLRNKSSLTGQADSWQFRQLSPSSAPPRGNVSRSNSTRAKHHSPHLLAIAGFFCLFVCFTNLHLKKGLWDSGTGGRVLNIHRLT